MSLSTKTRIDGHHALVTGASRGIGREVAIALAAQGASVTLLARGTEKLESVHAELSTADKQAHAIFALDMNDTTRLRDTIAEHTRARPVTILVNNSGGPPAGPASTAEIVAFESAFRQHLLAAQTLLTAVLPGMRTARYGRVINIISTSVKEPIPGIGVSNTVRAAVASWAKTLSRELGPDGITVNNVLPGYTDTDRLAEIFSARAAKSGQSVEDVTEAARLQVPLGRFADPAETALAVAFLASPAAGYINGINLPVDGGRTASL